VKHPVAAFGIFAVLILGSGPIAVAQDGATAGAPFVEAPSAPAPVSEERVTLRVGDVFEIVADAGTEGVTTSWILTQERTFIEAGRERLFRYRFVQDKEYTLRGEVTLPGTGERRQRTFVIDVRPVEDIPSLPVYPAGTGASLAGTVPAPDANGRVVFTPDQQLLQLAPIRSDLSPLALDLDASRDTDGDGNPGNDVDNTDTYFHSFGRSLWIWLARPLTQADVVITAVSAGGSPLVQRITILSEETAGEQGVLTSQVSIDVETIDDATFAFTPTLGRDVPPEAPLLYEWEFGDGNRSLENAPTHVYAASGTYEVKLQVRDLGTGNTVGTSSTSVSATVADTDPDEPDPVVEEPDPEPVEEPSTDEGLPWARIILIGALFVGSLLVGIAIVWLLSFLRRSRKLEETLETMEKAVAPSKEQTPPPLAIKGKPQTPPPSTQQKVIDAELNASSPSKTSPPAVTEAAAPDWLKKGLGSETPTSTSGAAPAVQKAAPAAKTAPTTAPATATAPVPKPTPTVAPKQQTQTPTPAPQTTQAPKPAPSTPPASPAPKPTPAPTTPAKDGTKSISCTCAKTPTGGNRSRTASNRDARRTASNRDARRIAYARADFQARADAGSDTNPRVDSKHDDPDPDADCARRSQAASLAASDASRTRRRRPRRHRSQRPYPRRCPRPRRRRNQNRFLPLRRSRNPSQCPSPSPPVTPVMPIVTPEAPVATPTQVTPPPATPIAPKPAQTPSQPILPQEPKDDDRPIAIIRAESIDPGPAK
jgi:PKD repeat protein